MTKEGWGRLSDCSEWEGVVEAIGGIIGFRYDVGTISSRERSIYQQQGAACSSI